MKMSNDEVDTLLTNLEELAPHLCPGSTGGSWISSVEYSAELDRCNAYYCFYNSNDKKIVRTVNFWYDVIPQYIEEGRVSAMDMEWVVGCNRNGEALI